jgi:hypothetical protein
VRIEVNCKSAVASVLRGMVCEIESVEKVKGN